MGALDLLPETKCDCTGTAGEDRCGGTLPDSPDCAINYHFGMLLGVDDFRTDQGFHLGHMRRHQRTLHGYGVVYGYAVSFDPEHAELHVAPGYALDRLGRDLYLDAEQCLGLPAWWEKHQADDAFADVPNKEDVTFDADVLLCYRTCLARPVPAIADPCAGSSIDIAYSRICESVHLALVPRTADAPPEAAAKTAPPPYHLLRLLTGLDEPLTDEEGDTLDDDRWLAEERAAIAGLPADERALATSELWQAVIARAAAATTDPTVTAELVAPPDPGDGSGSDTSACLVIARVTGIHVFKAPEGWRAAVASIDIDRRATLLPVQALQAELLRADAGSSAAAVAGPVVVEDGTRTRGSRIEVIFDKPLAPASVKSGAFTVTEFVPATGWASFTLRAPTYDDAERRVTLTLDRAPAGRRVRLTVRGTGPTPLLGADLVPAAAVSASDDGADVSITLPGS
jgi:hypothetical protein